MKNNSDNTQHILQELQLHHIELEFQNQEIKRVNAELESALKKYVNLYNFAPINCFTLSQRGEILEVNLTGITLLNMDENDKKNLQFQTFIHEDSLSTFDVFSNKVFDEGTLQSSELILLKKDRRKIYAHIDGIVVENEKDQTKQMLLAITDLTVAKCIEDQLKETQTLDKLKTEFFSNISHELRTPLNVIFSSLQLMERQKTSKSLENQNINIDKHHKIIRQNSRRLLRLVNNLIDSTKIDSGYYEGSFENEDIVKTIKYITLLVIPFAENKNIRIEFHCDMEKKVIKCDQDLIERAILNVLSNAVKFTPIGGKIVVHMYEKDQKVLISIKDNGIGIEKDDLKVIFQRFKQVDTSLTRKHEGSGIGLNITQSIIKMHDGTIYAESVMGEGSTFTIELPDRFCEKGVIEEDQRNDDRKNSQIERINIEFSDIYF